jgi:hypothetical protein
LQFVVRYKGRNFWFVGNRGRSKFRRYAAFFDPLYQILRDSVRVVAHFISQMSPFLPNAVCPDTPAVFQVYNVGETDSSATCNCEQQNDTAGTHKAILATHEGRTVGD